MTAVERRRLDELAGLLGLRIEKYYCAGRWYYEASDAGLGPVTIGTGPAVLASLERHAQAREVVTR